MFSHTRVNRPESKMMQTFGSVCEVAAPEAKSAVSDCILVKTEKHSEEQ